MRKLIWPLLLALALGGYEVSPTIALAQQPDGYQGKERHLQLQSDSQTKRYLITYMNSQTGEAIRSATVVTVTNQSGGTCDVTVQWFKGFLFTPECTTTFVGLENELTADFCSRSLPFTITSCNSTCDPELTFDEGRAVVSSSTETADGPDCSKIAVSARVYYTAGEEGDSAVAAITDSKVVRAGQGNRGD
jgi:hypothetical protein